MEPFKGSLINKSTIKNIKSYPSFEKRTLRLGSIVMFNDNTFGVYVDGSVAKKLSLKEEWTESECYFVAYTDNYLEEICFQGVDGYTEDLYDYDLGYDIVRIYKKRLSKDDILKIVNKDFAKNIRLETKDAEYIERR